MVVEDRKRAKERSRDSPCGKQGKRERRAGKRRANGDLKFFPPFSSAISIVLFASTSSASIFSIFLHPFTSSPTVTTTTTTPTKKDVIESEEVDAQRVNAFCTALCERSARTLERVLSLGVRRWIICTGRQGVMRIQSSLTFITPNQP